jgi:hypothetical protein
MVARPTGLGLENDCAGEGQEQFQATDPSYRQREHPTITTPHLSESNETWY